MCNVVSQRSWRRLYIYCDIIYEHNDLSIWVILDLRTYLLPTAFFSGDKCSNIVTSSINLKSRILIIRRVISKWHQVLACLKFVASTEEVKAFKNASWQLEMQRETTLFYIVINRARTNIEKLKNKFIEIFLMMI